MAEQSSTQEKTEQASEQKLRKSREDGQASRSKDLATLISLMATVFALKLSVGWFFDSLHAAFRLSYRDWQQGEIRLDDLQLIMTHQIVGFIKVLLPLAITPALVVLLSTLSGGWVFAAKNFHFKLGKLNPITGLGRIVGAQNATEFLKSLFKVGVLLALAVAVIPPTFPKLMALQRSSIQVAIASGLDLVFGVVLMLLAVFLVFALIDIPLQKFFFLKKMRMTKQERKDEHKTQEGRPEVKARIRQVQRQMAQRQVNRVLPLADAVIVNPQHYAVAIKYDPLKAKAPYVLAKGVDETALYIRRMAAVHGLELIEAPPLARAIYYTTQINQQIPAPLYAAVAHVLTYLLQLKAWRTGSRPRPQLPDHLPVPDHLANKSRP